MLRIVQYAIQTESICNIDAMCDEIGYCSGEKRYQLDAIIGQTHGIGVENLRGSGLIAGETSRAYDETFTLSYVTGRSVGIGAYLNRLGQRVIQMAQGPMILTGYSALNKLLGAWDVFWFAAVCPRVEFMWNFVQIPFSLEISLLLLTHLTIHVCSFTPSQARRCTPPKISWAARRSCTPTE